MKNISLKVVSPSLEIQTEAMKTDTPNRTIKFGVNAGDFCNGGRELTDYEKELLIKTAIMLYCEDATKGHHSLFHGEIIEDESKIHIMPTVYDGKEHFHYIVDTSFRKGIKRLGSYKFSIAIDKEQPNHLFLRVIKGKVHNFHKFDIMFVAKKQPVNNWFNIDMERAEKPFDMEKFNTESKVILASIK